MNEILNLTNGSIAGATIVVGVFLKKILKGKKIKNFELTRLLPLLIVCVSEALNIVYGIMTSENIIISISNGLITAFMAISGYDMFKSLYIKGMKQQAEEEKTEVKK